MLDRINSSMPLKLLLIKWAGILSKVKYGYGFSRASETLKHKTTVNTKGKRGGQWYITSTTGEVRILKMLRLTKQQQHVPQMENASSVRGSAWELVRKWVHHSGWGGRRRRGGGRNSCNQFSNSKFSGWVKKLGELFNISVNSTLLFCNMKMFSVKTILKKKKHVLYCVFLQQTL